MTKIRKVITDIIILLPLMYGTALFIMEVATYATGNKLLSLLIGLPGILFMLSCFQLLKTLAGTYYRSFKKFEIIKKSPLTFKFLPKRVALSRLFFLITIYNKTKIISGVFLRSPTSVLVCTDLYGKMRALSMPMVLLRMIPVMVYFGILMLFRILLPIL